MSTQPPQTDPDALKRLFAEAIDLPAAEREALLASVGSRDPDLLNQLVRLLRAHDQAGLFLAEPTRAAGEASLDADREQPGDRVGPFVLIERIGEGGFATVWRARQDEPVKREVALKILKPGMDSQQVLARFDAERQTLAMLSHPSIARVIDAGTTRGRPYFAMDLVAGRPITDFCDTERLGVRQRLRLFAAVCLAVQHAHQKGIVHRDLKPSNILVMRVDDQPIPVIIDFGIAKAIEGPLTGSAAVTEVRQLVGTPQYMAPEQAELGPAAVDTRTDVYSLGILLYELLTGVSPYDLERLRRAGLGELAKMVRDAQPSKPSTRFVTLGGARASIAFQRKSDEWRLVRELRGDLDWIVLRAIAKNPDERYPTANALALDIGHHLRDEPISAGPPSTVYRLAKFVRRHRVIASAGTVAAMAILVGLAMAVAGLRRANDMRDVAERALGTATRRLFDSYLAQARANRASAEPGRRADAIAALANAAAIRASLELRNEAAAALALDDLELREAPARSGYGSAWGLREPGLLLSADEPGFVRVVSTADNSEVMCAPTGGGTVLYGAFNADGSGAACTLTSADEAHVVVWEVPSGRLLGSFNGPAEYGAQHRLGTRADGSPWIAITSRNSVEVRALSDGAIFLEIPTGSSDTALDVAADGNLLVVADAELERVELWDVDLGLCRISVEIEERIASAALDAPGSLIALGLADRRVVLLDAATGEVVYELRGHQGRPVRLGFIRDGRAVASYAWDNTIRFWDVESGQPVLGPIEGWRPLGLTDTFFAESGDRAGLWSFSPSEVYERPSLPVPFGVNSEGAFSARTRYVTAGENGVNVLDGDTLAPLACLTTRPANSVCVLPESGTIVGACDEGVFAWDLPDGAGARALERLLMPIEPPGDVWVTPLPGTGGIVVVRAAEIALLSAETGRVERTLPAYRGLAERPHASPDGRWLFTGNWRGQAGHVWDLATGVPALTIEAQHVVGRFSPAGDCLVVGTPERFVCYETGSWAERWRVERPWTDTLAGVIGHDPDGGFVVVGYTRYQVRLVETSSGQEIVTLEGPDMHELNDAALSPDGQMLVCTTVDRVIQRWRLDVLRSRLREIDPGLDLLARAP